MRLADKVALITGAYGGMGRASARLFAKEGASVVVTGRKEDKGSALAREINDAGEMRCLSSWMLQISSSGKMLYIRPRKSLARYISW